MQSIAIISTIVTVSLIALRLLRLSLPLHDRLPTQWRWVPTALAAALTALTAGLPACSTPYEIAEVALGALVLGALAASPGYHADGGAS